MSAACQQAFYDSSSLGNATGCLEKLEAEAVLCRRCRIPELPPPLSGAGLLRG